MPTYCTGIMRLAVHTARYYGTARMLCSKCMDCTGCGNKDVYKRLENHSVQTDAHTKAKSHPSAISCTHYGKNCSQF